MTTNIDEILDCLQLRHSKIHQAPLPSAGSARHRQRAARVQIGGPLQQVLSRARGLEHQANSSLECFLAMQTTSGLLSPFMSSSMEAVLTSNSPNSKTSSTSLTRAPVVPFPKVGQGSLEDPNTMRRYLEPYGPTTDGRLFAGTSLPWGHECFSWFSTPVARTQVP